MNQYDAIVIGAGHNGLTNGAYLAKAGLKVAVLERNPYIGGATVSRELHKGWCTPTAPTYRACFDRKSHATSSYHGTVCRLSLSGVAPPL